MKIKYRPEIDGLRAIAVISVIIYHANIPFLDIHFLQGGFLGVDIFFVISGYLITLIILKELKLTNKFLFLHFYERRIRRIFPVLIVVTLTSLLIGYFYFLPSSLLELSKSSLSSVGFISNFYFYYSGLIYGGENGMLKPLLHTWSLSIEEQFYIIFPFFLFISYKYFKKHLLRILLIVLILSLIIAEYSSKYYFIQNFYFLHSRLWELLSGSILAYIEINENKIKSFNQFTKTLPTIGLFIIIFSLFFFNDKTRLPSFYTLIPISGVCLIISFANKNNFIIKILSSKLLVGLGLISFSLYMWHYPAFAFYRYLFVGTEGNYNKYFLILFIFVISILSFYLIEKKARNKIIISFNSFLKITIPLIILIIVLSSCFIINDGFKEKAFYGKITVDNSFYDKEFNNWLSLNNQNQLNAEIKKKILFFGNSHAIDTYVIFKSNENLFKNFNFGLGSLNALKTYTNIKNNNLLLNNNDLKIIDEADIIIFSNRWSQTMEELQTLDSLIEKLKKYKKIIIMSENIEAPSLGIAYIPLFDWFIIKNKKLPNNEELQKLEEQYFDNVIRGHIRSTINLELERIAKKNNIQYLDKSLYQCDYLLKKCKILTDNGYKINRDTHHLTLEGAKFLGKEIYKRNLLDLN